MPVDPNWQLARKLPFLKERARILQQVRAFFMEQDFLEVETPHRIPVNAPEMAIDAVPSDDWFLHTSPELCMKRLLAAGYDKLYQICRCWRAKERSKRHLPEYTMLEWYHRDSDYRQLMNDCEQMLNFLNHGQEILIWQGQTVNISLPWQRLTVTEAFERFSPVPLKKISCPEQFSELITTAIEPNLPKNKPVFLIDYPSLQGSLARCKPDDSTLVERFELYFAGMELANGFSELTDPLEQRRRFIIEEATRRGAGKLPHPLPEPFLEELQHLTSASGIALGVDRLIMLLCDAGQIDEIVCFTPEQL